MDKKSIFPFITIAMPVRDEEKFIATTLQEIVEQNYPADRFEVIVADGISQDKTRSIVEGMIKKYPQIRLLDNPGLLPSSGRNVGFENGKGDIFLVIDGHCKIGNKNLLRNVADCFGRSGAHCLGRPQPFITPEKPTTQKAIALARASKLGHSTKSHIHSVEEGYVSPVSMGCAYKKDVFKKIGYLDESFDACEDVEFNYRVEKAGFKTFFSPSIAVHYYPRDSFSKLWTQLIRYGKGRVRFIAKHPEQLNVETFLPALFVLGVVIGPFLSLLHPVFFGLYTLTITLYACVVATESIRLGWCHGALFTLKVGFALFVVHFSLGTGFIMGAITPKPKQHAFARTAK